MLMKKVDFGSINFFESLITPKWFEVKIPVLKQNMLENVLKKLKKGMKIAWLVPKLQQFF